MKFTIEFLVEVALIASTSMNNDEVYVVMNYTALTVVSYIDTSYFESIKDSLKDKMVNVQKQQLPI
jgi:hypothetical protein